MPARVYHRRVELPDDLYAELEREARWLHVTPTAVVAMLLSDALARSSRLNHDPLEHRFSPAAAAELRAPVRHPDR